MNALPVRIREITLSFCVRIIRGSPSLQNIYGALVLRDVILLFHLRRGVGHRGAEPDHPEHGPDRRCWGVEGEARPEGISDPLLLF